MASEATISDLTLATTINDNDNMIIEDAISTKRITPEKIAEYVSNKLDYSAITNQISDLDTAFQTQVESINSAVSTNTNNISSLQSSVSSLSKAVKFEYVSPNIDSPGTKTYKQIFAEIWNAAKTRLTHHFSPVYEIIETATFSISGVQFATDLTNGAALCTSTLRFDDFSQGSHPTLTGIITSGESGTTYGRTGIVRVEFYGSSTDVWRDDVEAGAVDIWYVDGSNNIVHKDITNDTYATSYCFCYATQLTLAADN